MTEPRIDEAYDEQMAERAQAAYDHGLDLEYERADCKPLRHLREARRTHPPSRPMPGLRG